MQRMRSSKTMTLSDDVNKSSTLKRLLQLAAKGNGLRYFIVISAMLIAAYINVLFATYLRIFIDDYLEPLLISDVLDFGPITAFLIKVFVVSLVGVLAGLISSQITVEIAQGVIRGVREKMFAHMQKLPLKFFDTNAFGDVMSYYTNDTDTLNQMLSQSIPQFFSSGVTIFFVVIAMWQTSIILTLVVFFLVIFMIQITKHLGGKSRYFFKARQEAVGKLNGYVEEMVTGQKVIKVFNHEQAAIEEFEKLNNDVRSNAESASKFANIFFPIMMNFGNLQYIILAMVGGWLVLKGHQSLTTGAIIAFLTLSKSFSNPVTQVSQQINSITMALAGADRIFKLMDEPIEIDEGVYELVDLKLNTPELVIAQEKTGRWAWRNTVDASAPLIEFQGEVYLTEVNFSYVADKPVLNEVSVYARKGEKVALVGATGAGKTTITNLINRFYDINDGSITIDGIGVKEIKKAALRKALGMVLQDTSLFTGTVMENIRYGDLHASDTEVIEAAKRANAASFIERLPAGFQTRLTGNGENLSQGQRQLLSIARAAVANPPILILDEATSSIDTRTEHLVQAGMDELMKGRTVFVIAHRLSTIKNADVIMVMEKGRIIERGNHEKLLAERGIYYDLYMGKFELE